MAQIINDLDLGSLIGRQLGTGISKGLGTLAQYKMQDIMKRQQKDESRDAYEKMKPGMGWLADTPENVQKAYVEGLYREHPELFDNPNTPQEETLQDFAPYRNLIQEEMMGQLENMYPQPGQMNAGQMVGDVLRGRMGMGQPKEGIGTQMLREGMLQPRAPQTVTGAMQDQRLTSVPERTPEGRRLSRTERFALLRDQRKADLREMERLDKTYQPIIHQMSNQYSSLMDQNRSLDRMETLIKKGKLPSPKVAAGLDFLNQGATIVTPWGSVHLAGLNFKSAMGKNAEEFEKLSNDFIKNAKNIFGNRITDNDLKAFMSTVPNLMMTDEGKLRVIHNMRLYNEGVKARHDAMKSILRENNGRPPRNFELLIEERADSKLRDIAQRFSMGPKKQPKTTIQKIKKGIDKAWNKLPGISDIVSGALNSEL